MTAPAAATRSTPALPGRAFPLGATARDGGTNFAVASAADSNACPELRFPVFAMRIRETPSRLTIGEDIVGE
jgi:hypothetical protein